MYELTRVSSTEFSKEVGRYQDLALTQPVVVTRNGRDRTVIISAHEYERLRRAARRGEGATPEAGSAGKQPAAAVDAATMRAVAAFLDRIRQSHAPVSAVLFGSRARGTHRPDSDADIAVILKGKPKDRFAVLQPMSDAAYDVLMETGIYIQPLPLWEAEMKQPQMFGNPSLIETIKREGVRL